eukprot:CAMPEP_0119411548 /NCGR_PEP_ID=MMETSP1335-20130426/4262_1 /TAXON_ID=259385 /ORGANISM="Chrysoculter rhomboideus, Strain RCC1486" /LENGTH=116 /DNA_ID=CAMNT_0007436199 /DNA_START=178 /DNA_END=529 /DNA_ORIENTATION=-
MTPADGLEEPDFERKVAFPHVDEADASILVAGSSSSGACRLQHLGQAPGNGLLAAVGLDAHGRADGCRLSSISALPVKLRPSHALEACRWLPLPDNLELMRRWVGVAIPLRTAGVR